MDCPALDHRDLTPLNYHSNIVNYLREHEADVWAWAQAREQDEAQLQALRDSLLRDTYRIDAGAHEAVHASLKLAQERLGIAQLPVTLYQAPGDAMNASLIYTPSEAHILLQGPVLERLSEAELLAVFGHELAHYLLWQQQERCYLAAERILAHASDSGQGRDSHRESYRRYRLHTELFADRGAAIAAGGTAAAITTLVKMHTGMTSVDAQAYLRQAEEIEARETAASAEASHPETFVRARALAMWWAGDEQLDAWLGARLKGPLTLSRLDLPEQVHLQALTRQFIAWYLQGSGLGSDSVLAQVRLLFSDWADDETPLEPQALLDAAVDNSVLGYFNALMVDLALADPDQQDAALLRAGAVAERLGCLPALLANLRRDANFNKRDLDRFKRELAKEARP